MSSSSSNSAPCKRGVYIGKGLHNMVYKTWLVNCARMVDFVGSIVNINFNFFELGVRFRTLLRNFGHYKHTFWTLITGNCRRVREDDISKIRAKLRFWGEIDPHNDEHKNEDTAYLLFKTCRHHQLKNWQKSVCDIATEICRESSKIYQSCCKEGGNGGIEYTRNIGLLLLLLLLYGGSCASSVSQSVSHSIIRREEEGPPIYWQSTE